MFGSKSKKTNKKSSGNAGVMVRQDSHTSVKTTTAHTETTNTTVQNATIFNTERNTVTMQSTRQTVTHQQTAGVTEIVRRIDPTDSELEVLLRQMNLNRAESNAKRRSSGNYANYTASGKNVGGISAKSATKFKSTANPQHRMSFVRDSINNSNNAKSNATPTAPTTPTVVKIEEVTATQKTGRKVTTTTETQQIKLSVPRSFKLSTPNSPLSKNYSSNNINNNINNNSKSLSSRAFPPFTDAKPFGGTSTYNSPTTLTTGTSTSTTAPTYKSPYSNRTISAQPASSRVTSSASSWSSSPASVKSTWLNASKSTTSPTLSSNIFNREFSSTPAAPAIKASNWTMPTLPLKSTATTATTASNTPLSLNGGRASSVSNMVSKKKSKLQPGYCYIFHHVKFDMKDYEERVGSSEDVKRLSEIFNSFKLKIKLHENKTVTEINTIVQKMEKKDFTQNSCVVVVILSHGNRYEEILARDGTYSIDDNILFPLLRNRTLHDKPKIFFVQACKGNRSADKLIRADTVVAHGSPNEILKCYSTFEGYKAFRTPEGSFFISALCKHLKADGKTKNIKDIVDAVISTVKFSSGNTQIPSVTSTLTKSYIFGDYV